LVKPIPITITQETPEWILNEIMALSREHQISTYDASYLDLAMREGLPLATLDKELRKAANRANVQIC